MTAYNGNAKLLDSPHLHHVIRWPKGKLVTRDALNAVEREAEEAVLSSKILVVGTNLPAPVFVRAGVVPLRWGSCRILVAYKNWKGERVKQSVDKNDEPEPCFRLWRYKWDGETDLVATP